MSRRAWIQFGFLAAFWGASYLFIKVALEDDFGRRRSCSSARRWPRWCCCRCARAPARSRGLRGQARARSSLLAARPGGGALPADLASASSTSPRRSPGSSWPPRRSSPSCWPSRSSGEERAGGAQPGRRGHRHRRAWRCCSASTPAAARAALVGGLMVVLASLGYALGACYLKRSIHGVQPMGVVAATMAASALMVAPFAAIDLPPHGARAGRRRRRSWRSGVLGTGISFVLFYSLIAGGGPGQGVAGGLRRAGLLGVYGVTLLDESFTLATAAGLVLIVGGSWLAAEGRLPWQRRQEVPGTVSAPAAEAASLGSDPRGPSGEPRTGVLDRPRTEQLGLALAPGSRAAASWPQAASMSRPRVRRTVARTPRASSAASKAAIAAPARALEARLGGVVGDQVHLERARAGWSSVGQRQRLLEAVVHAVEHQVLHEHRRGAGARASAGRRRARRAAGSGRSPASAPSAAPRRARAARAPAAPAAPRASGARCPGSSPRWRSPCARGDAQLGQPLAGREHRVEVQERLAHAHEHGVVDRRPCAGSAAPGRGSPRSLRLRPKLHRAGGAEGAGQRAARLAREAERAAAVAVAHEHRLERAPVVRVEERLLGAVGRQRLVARASARRTALRPASASRSSSGRFGHLLVGARSRAGHSHTWRARKAARRARRAARRAARGPRPQVWQPPRRAPGASSWPTPVVASRRAAEELVRRGRVSVAGETVTDPARDVDESSGVAVDGRAGRPGAPRGARAQQAARCGVHGAATRTDGRRWWSWCARAGACTRSAASTPRPPGLILLTNDGDAGRPPDPPALRRGEGLPRPRRAEAGSSDRALRRLREGVELEDGRTAPARVRARAPGHGGAHHPRGPQAPGAAHDRGGGPPRRRARARGLRPAGTGRRSSWGSRGSCRAPRSSGCERPRAEPARIAADEAAGRCAAP